MLGGEVKPWALLLVIANVWLAITLARGMMLCLLGCAIAVEVFRWPARWLARCCR